MPTQAVRGEFGRRQCVARLRKWRHRLKNGEGYTAVECWSNIDALLDAYSRLLRNSRVSKPWETDDPVPDGA